MIELYYFIIHLCYFMYPTENPATENPAKKKQREEENKKKEEALARLSQDISMVDDDHLDLTLHKEEEFLNQYLTLLQD